MEENSKIINIIGNVFIMNHNRWKVKTKGINGWYGIECQNSGAAFTSMHIDDINKYL